MFFSAFLIHKGLTSFATTISSSNTLRHGGISIGFGGTSLFPSAGVLTIHLVAQVLQEMPSPTGPQLHLSPTFATRDNQDKLEQFIRQFICS